MLPQIRRPVSPVTTQITFSDMVEFESTRVGAPVDLQWHPLHGDLLAPDVATMGGIRYVSPSSCGQGDPPPVAVAGKITVRVLS